MCAIAEGYFLGILHGGPMFLTFMHGGQGLFFISRDSPEFFHTG